MSQANVYKQVSIPEGAGQQRIVGTHINWEHLGIKPAIIAENSARISARIKLEKGELNRDPVAIVAFGPSLRDNWREVRAYDTIFTCSGAHRFLLDRGVVPTYHVDSDPRPHKVDLLGDVCDEVTYLLASICHPTYFDKMELYRCKVKLWHMLFLEPEIFQYYPKLEWIMTGGHTVGPRAIKLARMMGYGNLHIFGMDGSTDSEGRTHANDHPNPPTDLEWIKFDGRKYFTNRNWEDHAHILMQELDRMPELTCTFHGTGLIQEIAKSHIKVQRAPMPLRVYKDEDGKCMW